MGLVGLASERIREAFDFVAPYISSSLPTSLIVLSWFLALPRILGVWFPSLPYFGIPDVLQSAFIYPLALLSFKVLIGHRVTFYLVFCTLPGRIPSGSIG